MYQVVKVSQIKAGNIVRLGIKEYKVTGVRPSGAKINLVLKQVEQDRFIEKTFNEWDDIFIFIKQN